MEHSSNQHIKGYLMTIVKYGFIITILIINLTYKNMDKREIKVLGDKELLKECDVNLQFLFQDYQEGKYHYTYICKTILHRGIIRAVPYEDFDLIEIYVSRKGSMVNVFKFENLLRNMKEPSDIVLILEKNNKGDVIIKCYGLELILIPKEEFYKVNNIENEEEIKRYDQLFFNEY